MEHDFSGRFGGKFPGATERLKRKSWFPGRNFPIGNRPLQSSKNPHFQNETKCSAFLVKMSFICVRMKNPLEKSFPDKRLSIEPRFDTETRRNLEMAYWFSTS